MADAAHVAVYQYATMQSCRSVKTTPCTSTLIRGWTGICCKRYDDNTLQHCIVTLLECCTGNSQNPGFPMRGQTLLPGYQPLTLLCPSLHQCQSRCFPSPSTFPSSIPVSSRLLHTCPLCSRVDESEQVVEDEVTALSVGEKLEGLRIAHRSLLCFDLQPQKTSAQHGATQPHGSCLYSPTMLRSPPPRFRHSYCSAVHRSC